VFLKVYSGLRSRPQKKQGKAGKSREAERQRSIEAGKILKIAKQGSRNPINTKRGEDTFH
jgi:hypothetical protein